MCTVLIECIMASEAMPCTRALPTCRRWRNDYASLLAAPFESAPLRAILGVEHRPRVGSMHPERLEDAYREQL